MYVEIAWTRQRILASYLHNYKLRKLIFLVSKNLFFHAMKQNSNASFRFTRWFFFCPILYEHNGNVMCQVSLKFFYRDLKMLVQNAIWKCDLKMRKNAKKRFSTCKSGDAECEMRHGILIGKFIFWRLRYYDYRIWFW